MARNATIYGSEGAPTKSRGASVRGGGGAEMDPSLRSHGAAERTRWAEIAGVWAGPRQARLSGPGGGARAGPALDAGDEWPDQAPPPARPGRFIL